MVIVPSGGKPQTVSQRVMEADSIADAAYDPLYSRDDQNWINLSGDPLQTQYALDFRADDRKRQVARARYFHRTYPLAKRAINLFVTFVLGQGVTFHADNADIHEVLEDFWNDLDNRIVFTSVTGQKRALTKRQVDGEIFLALFTGPNGRVKVRLLDPIEITTIITDPDDSDRPLYYERMIQKRYYDFKDRTYKTEGEPQYIYYADVANADLPNRPPNLAMNESGDEPVRVIHEKINALGQRGVSDLYAALDWLAGHRSFMEDRLNITRALAKIAWKMKVKGGPAIVAASAQKERSGIVRGGGGIGTENNPSNIAGSTFVGNDGADMTPVKTDTGSAGASTDGRMIVAQVGAATGIMQHYLGDSGSISLAGSTSMDLPMLKLFEEAQEMWRDFLRRVFQYVIIQAIKVGKVPGEVTVVDNYEQAEYPEDISEHVRISYPLIVQRETWAMMQSLIAARASGAISQERFSHEALTILGVENIEQEVAAALLDPPPALQYEGRFSPASGPPPPPTFGTPANAGDKPTIPGAKPGQPNTTTGIPPKAPSTGLKTPKGKRPAGSGAASPRNALRDPAKP